MAHHSLVFEEQVKGSLIFIDLTAFSARMKNLEYKKVHKLHAQSRLYIDQLASNNLIASSEKA